MKYLILICAVVLGGCDVQYSSRPIAEQSGPSEPDGVRVVELLDGTRCAIFEGLRKAGISCDWSKPEAEAIHE